MKDKRDKKELTRLIMTALILGGGCLYGPVAEVDAQELEVDINMYPENYSSWPDLKKNGLILDASNKKLYLKSNTDTLKFNNTDTRWNGYNIFGVYRSGGTANGYTVTLETGPSAYHYALGTLIGGNTDSGKAYSNHVYMNGGTALYVNGGKSQNGQVSDENVYDNTVNITGGEVTQNVYGGESYKGDANNNSVTIGASTGSITIGSHVFGGLAGSNIYGNDGSAINNTVTVGNSTTISGTVYGGYSHEGTSSMSTSVKEASSNTVTINGGVLNHIMGGYGVNGNAKNNTVTISNGIINGDIIGAFSALNTYYNKVKITAGNLNGDNKTISGAIGDKLSYNSVSIGGGNFNSKFYSIGGVYNNTYIASEITHNSLNLYGTTTGLDKATLAGGYSEHNTGSVSTTDNNIYIGGSRVYANGATSATLQDETPWVGKDSSGNIKNTVVTVKNVDKLVLRKVNWSTTVPVLNMTDTIRFNTNGVLDISGMTFANSTSNGTMTLLSGTNPILNLKTLTYSGGSATLSASPITVKAGTSTDKDIGSGVTLTYDTGSHTVKLDDATTTKKVLYTIGDGAVNKVTLGNMTWGTGASGTGYTFGSGTTINAANLTFTGSFNSNPINQTTNLLSNANGIKDSTTAKAINLAASFQDANGIGYSGAATNGNVISSNTNKNITYKVTGATLDSLNLAGWNGSTSTLLSGWSKKNGGISVSGVFTKPTLAPGASKDIMTTTTADFFSDATISDDIKYKTGDSFSDTVAGVTLAGNKAGGVKATNSGKNLTFYGEKNDVSSISLGSMTWGTPRAATTAYDFSGVTNIDASGLTFTGTATLNSLNDSTNLLTGATGLTSDTITQPTNKTFNISYTDNTTKITYKGQATNGSLTRDNTNLKYTISAGKVNEIDLGQWNGTAAPALPNTWDTPSGGVAVDTGDFESPTGTDNVDIFTTTEDGFFNENNITGDKKYKDNEPMPDDKKDGVTISGTKSGGIAPSEDGLTPTTSGKRLTYFAESTTGTGISLGEVAWNKDGTARTLTGNYTFSDLGDNDVDATGLKFTFTDETDGKSVNKIAKNDTMTILSGATGLNAGLTVKSSPVSQSISYSGLANKVGLTGTLTGNVTTTDGKVNYKVSSKTLDSVNLSGWDGNNTDLDASWTNNANGINVTGSGFTAPTNVGDTPILTATGANKAGYFTNAIIADNIKFQPSGAYSETEKNVTLSGTRASGVKANDDGDKLVYSIGAAFINNVKLGTVTYNTTGTPWISKTNKNEYDFSYLTSLDTTGFVMSMTEAQRKSAAKDDTMTLIAGNNTMGDIAAKDAGIINYSYDAKAGSITVGGTVTGSVSASGNNVLYTVKDNTATTLDLATVKWGETYARSGSELNFSNAVVNSSNIFFTGVNTLTKDQVMTLISNYGGNINKTRAGIFTVDDGNGNILKGKGVAYYDKINDKLMYKVTLGAGETQPTVNAVNKKEVLNDPSDTPHPGTVTGGEAQGDGESTGNEADVKGKVVTNDDGTGGDVNGGTSEEGDSKRNKADVEDSKIDGDVNGGKSDNGNSTDNEADVDNSTVGGDVNGGDTNGDGGTKGNRTNVKHGSIVKGNVNGGHSGGNGDSTGNEANVGDSTVDHDVNGGYSEGSGNANENKTTVSGSTIGGGVNGGHSGTGSTNKNETTVSDSTVTGGVTGGRNDGDGTANENRTTVSGSNVGGDVIGGQSNNGNTNQNEVSVSGGSVGGEVIGGKTENGSSSNNNVTISGNTDVNGKVYGGYSANGSASGNAVTIKNASVRDYVYGGKSKSQSSNNSVLFEPGKALGIIGGGCEVSTNNTAELKEGSVDEHVIGGFATATATSNTATVTGGTVTGSVIGGYGGTTAADNNTVNLGGGTVTGNTITSATLGVTIDGGVYGGYSVSGTTQNNTVNIFGSADVSNTGLFGGNLQYNGNVLNIGYNNTPWTGGGQSVKDIKNFESMNFSIVPWSTTQAGVTISNGGSSDLSMTTVSAKEVAFTGVRSLAVNDTMTLLNQSAVDGAKQATNVVENSNYTLGTVQEGTGTLTKDANGNVLYQVETASVSKQTHNTVMAAEAALVSINAGNDFINSATDGLARDENMGKDGMATYAKIGGQSLEHETGSHVNVNTWNAILAVGHKNVKKKSTFEYGAFVEHGRGNFTTHNDGLRGDGSVDYTGGGLLAKWKTNKGTYVEGSFRAGSVHEKANNLLRDAVQGYGYDERTNYMGFHIGVGKETVLKNGNVLDFYGKYFYNRKNGMDFNAGIDEYNLDAVTSQVLRVGTRYTVKSGSRWNYYGDLSYEYEFDGMATGRANGLAIRGADISGGSVRLELGASLVPNDESPWNVDFNLTAYAGKKQGVSGGVSLKYSF